MNSPGEHLAQLRVELQPLGRVRAGLASSGASRALGVAARCVCVAAYATAACVGAFVVVRRRGGVYLGNTARSPATRVTGALRSK